MQFAVWKTQQVTEQCIVFSLFQKHDAALNIHTHTQILQTNKKNDNVIKPQCPQHLSRQRAEVVVCIYITKTLGVRYCNEGDFDCRHLMFKHLLPPSHLLCHSPLSLTLSPLSLFPSILLLSSLSGVIFGHMLLCLLIVCEFVVKALYQQY